MKLPDCVLGVLGRRVAGVRPVRGPAADCGAGGGRGEGRRAACAGGFSSGIADNKAPTTCARKKAKRNQISEHKGKWKVL